MRVRTANERVNRSERRMAKVMRKNIFRSFVRREKWGKKSQMNKRLKTKSITRKFPDPLLPAERPYLPRPCPRRP